MVMIVLKCNKAEWLKNASRRRPHRVEHLGHAFHVAGTRLENNHDEVSAGESFGQLQQTACARDDLQPGLGTVSVAKLDDSGSGCKLNARGTLEGIDLGIVCHAANHYDTGRTVRRDYRSAMYGFLAVRVLIRGYPYGEYQGALRSLGLQPLARTYKH